jgi:hypothetical protein
MTKHLMRFVLGIAIVVTCSSCDDLGTKSSEERITISPDAVTLEIGQQQEFIASDGYEYAWSLEDETIGTLSTRSGESTIYTSLYTPDGTGTTSQVLMLVSTIEGGGTNRVYHQTAEAYILHISTDHPAL